MNVRKVFNVWFFSYFCIEQYKNLSFDYRKNKMNRFFTTLYKGVIWRDILCRHVIFVAKRKVFFPQFPHHHRRQLFSPRRSRILRIQRDSRKLRRYIHVIIHVSIFFCFWYDTLTLSSGAIYIKAKRMVAYDPNRFVLFLTVMRLGLNSVVLHNSMCKIFIVDFTLREKV